MSLPRISLVPFDPARCTQFDDDPNGARLIDELCASIYRRETQNRTADDEFLFLFNRIEYAHADAKREKLLCHPVYGMGECFFVADPLRGHLPIGFMMVQPMDDAGHFEVGLFFLEEERDRKYGRSALAKLEGVMADERGATHIMLQTDAMNIASLRSLSASGYQAQPPARSNRTLEFPSGSSVTLGKVLASPKSILF